MVPKTTSNGFQKCLPRDEKNDCICQLTHTTPATGRPKRRVRLNFSVETVPPGASAEKSESAKQLTWVSPYLIFRETAAGHGHRDSPNGITAVAKRSTDQFAAKGLNGASRHPRPKRSSGDACRRDGCRRRAIQQW